MQIQMFFKTHVLFRTTYSSISTLPSPCSLVQKDILGLLALLSSEISVFRNDKLSST